jgi:SEC-C motif
LRKVGRNDPCPCGSGKKYKKCHGSIVSLPPRGAEAFTIEANRMQAEADALRARGILIHIPAPVVANDRKVWALGSRVYLDRQARETFHEFIIDRRCARVFKAHPLFVFVRTRNLIPPSRRSRARPRNDFRSAMGNRLDQARA